jgi:acrylyl-CoA reductase (NADPH)
MSNQQFKAMVVEETADKTYVRDIKLRGIDELPHGDVLVQVLYSSLNYKDALSAIGNKGVTRNFPHTPGIDAAGIVAQSERETPSSSPVMIWG